MLDYFRTTKDAFGWQKKPGLKKWAIFVLKSVLAYIFLVGLYRVGFRVVLFTPLMDYMTVGIVSDITINTLRVLSVLLLIPIILHAIKTMVWVIKAGIH